MPPAHTARALAHRPMHGLSLDRIEYGRKGEGGERESEREREREKERERETHSRVARRGDARGLPGT